MRIGGRSRFRQTRDQNVDVAIELFLLDLINTGTAVKLAAQKRKHRSRRIGRIHIPVGLVDLLGNALDDLDVILIQLVDAGFEMRRFGTERVKALSFLAYLLTEFRQHLTALLSCQGLDFLALLA